jgi:hypothetical protein
MSRNIRRLEKLDWSFVICTVHTKGDEIGRTCSKYGTDGKIRTKSILENLK